MSIIALRTFKFLNWVVARRHLHQDSITRVSNSRSAVILNCDNSTSVGMVSRTGSPGSHHIGRFPRFETHVLNTMILSCPLVDVLRRESVGFCSFYELQELRNEKIG